MYAHVLVWILFVGCCLSACGSSPVTLPITNVELSNGHIRRGILGAIGTPAQNISFMPHTYLNDTWIYNATDAFCGSKTSDQCLTWRGGIFEPEKSSTYTYQIDVTAAGGSPSDVTRGPGTHVWYNSWATDTLSIGDTAISNFAIGMPGLDIGGDFDGQANFGLGHNSTLLQRMKDDGRISSRSWSFWWGVENALSRSAMDGHLILGGYDAAKAVGVPFTQPLLNSSAACQSGMTLSITNLLLNFPNGTSSDLNPSAVLSACIQPDFPSIMTVPATPYWWRYQDVTGTTFVNKSLGTNWFVPVFPSSNVYAGDLEMHIQGGPAVTIPNDVPAVPNEYIDASGAVQHNDSAADVLFSPIDGDNIHDQLIIGKQFFSGAYLTVNLDNQTWSIWPAQATADTRITAIGDGCGEVTNTTTHPGVSPSAVPSATAKTTSNELSTGAKAGISAGCGCVVLALIGAVIFCAIKKHRTKKKKTAVRSVDNHARGYPSADQRWQHQTYWTPVQEMAGSQTVPYELKSEEKPAELANHSSRQLRGISMRYHAAELPSERY